MKEFWTRCILVMTVSKTVMVKTGKVCECVCGILCSQRIEIF